MYKGIGKRIQLLRKEKGLTQLELSEEINISSKFLSDIETGKKGMSLNTFICICDSLNANANYLLNIDNSKNTPITLVKSSNEFCNDSIELAEKILFVIHNFLNKK